MKNTTVWIIVYEGHIEGVYDSFELALQEKNKIIEHHSYKVEPGFSYAKLNESIKILSYVVKTSRS